MIEVDINDNYESVPEEKYTSQIKTICRIKMGSIPYTEFYNEFLQKNCPCIISEVTNNWIANIQWIDSQTNRPNFHILKSNYGDIEVPVVDCNYDNQNNCVKRTTVFSEYLNYWENCCNNKSTLPISYLKDWHLRKQRPNDNFYYVPEYFSSDWLNEYSMDKGIDDYMFVYMGPKGSWTPFHADVFKSFSWSANVVGKKRWLLFPPGEERKFLDSFGNFPSDIEKCIDENSKFFEIIQNPGEAIFVPSGWYHQVFNIENTISINHNWVNSCNIQIMWNSLKDNLSLVENEIKEFKHTEGWPDHCQLMLQALFGMNINDFIEFIKHITSKRLQSFKNGISVTFDRWTFGKNHLLKDLQTIKNILIDIVLEVKLKKIENTIDLEELKIYIENINEFL